LAPDTRGYAICTEPRSGSEYLCEILKSTRLLGNPLEQFMSAERCRRFEREPAWLGQEILGRGATANGIYGLKVMSRQFDNSLASRWPERLPGLRFVHLERRDLLGQAISWVRARQTGQYFSITAAQGEARYDAAAIARAIGEIAEGQARWRRYFARNGIDALWLVHEEVAADPQAAAESIARLLGLDEQPRVDPERIRLRAQRDGLSEEWRERFVAERADLRFLDHPLGWGRIKARRLARDAGLLLVRLRRR
jgi:LPS sulfotransferase NodH